MFVGTASVIYGLLGLLRDRVQVCRQRAVEYTLPEWSHLGSHRGWR